MVSRKYGLTLDWMKNATVVLQNGTIVHCSESEHSDLFWAIRGAGSSFGTVAEYGFETFPAPECQTIFRPSRGSVLTHLDTVVYITRTFVLLT